MADYRHASAAASRYDPACPEAVGQDAKSPKEAKRVGLKLRAWGYRMRAALAARLMASDNIHFMDRSSGDMGGSAELTRFKINKHKTVEAIHAISEFWPGITQYFVCKTFYFADKDSYLDWGRPISGDFYVAMPHGPVPSRIYELLKPSSGEEDDWLKLFDQLIETRQSGKLTHLYPKKPTNDGLLSRSDRAALQKWIEFFQSIPEERRFDEIWRLSHEEASWRAARKIPGNAPEMDLSIWAKEIGVSEDDFRRTIAEEASFAAVRRTEMGGD